MSDSDDKSRLCVSHWKLTQVAVRIRPVSQKEAGREHCSIVARALDSHTVHIIDPADEFNEDVLRKDRNKEKVYAYDHVFDEHCSQIEVFEKTTKTLLDSVIQGYNATVFAYGATGAGKTHVCNLMLTLDHVGHGARSRNYGIDFD